MQSKKQSFIEASTNTAIGFVISYGSTFIIFPLMGFESSASKNIIITLFFTAVNILRGYVIRRFFNNKKVVKRSNEPDISGFPEFPPHSCINPHFGRAYCEEQCDYCKENVVMEFDV